MAFGLEGACPSSVAFLLTVLTVIIVINSLYLLSKSIQQIFQLLVLLSIQNLLNLLHPLLQLILIVCHHNDMQRFIVLKNILLSLVCPSPSNRNLTSWSLFNQLLSLSPRTNNLTYVVCFRIVDRILAEIDLFEFLQRSIVIRGNESTFYKLVRLTHLDAILNEGNPLSHYGIPLTHLSSVDSLPLVVVDRFGTGRSQVQVFRYVIFHLRGELIKPIEP